MTRLEKAGTDYAARSFGDATPVEEKEKNAFMSGFRAGRSSAADLVEEDIKGWDGTRCATKIRKLWEDTA